MQAFHVRIDRLTQGPDGQEHGVDRSAIDTTDFLWIYVDALLRDSGAPEGEYLQLVNARPDPTTRVLLGRPTAIGQWFRYSVEHYTLSAGAQYLFHFADHLERPEYQDAWDVATLSQGGNRARAFDLPESSIRNAVRFAQAMERLKAPQPRFRATAPTAGLVVPSPPTTPANPVTIAAVPSYWSKSCAGGDSYDNNCAHFLSDAMLRTGFTQLSPPADCIQARCNTTSQRPIRARDMWCWFKSMATKTGTTPTKNTGAWAVFQLNESEYWGGHVVMLDSDAWKYYGTGWYDDWDQYLYQW